MTFHLEVAVARTVAVGRVTALPVIAFLRPVTDLVAILSQVRGCRGILTATSDSGAGLG